jgi:maltose-binding periplasmic protein
VTLTRRSFLSITAVAAALTAAVVYGSDSGGASSASGNNLIIWADQKKADSLTEFAKKWGEQQGITVTVQTVANDLQSNFITANQAGNGPDVVLGAHDWIGNLVQNGSILPIALSAEARANYTDIALRAVTYEGQTYAAPYAVECLSLFVNKDLTQVTAPTTIEELIAAGKAAGTEVILSLPVGEKGDAYNMEPIYTAAGGYLFGKDANGDYLAGDLGVGGEGSIAAAKKIGALGADGVLRNSITGDNAISLFTGGKAPYLVSGPWALGDIKKAGINYTIAKIPGFGDIEGSAATPFAGVNCFYVASKGEHRAFAETLVADVARDSSFAEAMFPLNELPPAQKDLADKLKSSNPDMVTISEFAAAADPMPAIPAMSAVWQPLGLAQANIVKGADPEQTMRSAGEEIKRNIG